MPASLAASFSSHRRVWLAGALLVVFALGLALWAYLRAGGGHGEILVVEARQLKQTIVSSGQVMPPAEVRLESLLTSKVKRVLRREGDVVAAGEVLLVLDEREIDAALAQASAALAQAKAGRVGLASTTLPQANEALAQIRANLREARLDFERQKTLFEGDVTTASVVEKAQRAVSIYESQEKAALAQIRAASSGGAAALTAAAAIALAEAQLAAVKVSKERATIVAPMDGVISQRLVEVGEVVRPGTSLMVLTAQGRTRIVLEPDERNLALLQLGQRAVVSAEAYPAEVFDATVGYIAPAVNGARGTIEVRLNVGSPPAYLRPNMTVSVELEVATRANALAVPLTAVGDLGSAQPWVAVVGPRGQALRRPVRLGLRGDEAIEVLAGLVAGERIYLEPPPNLGR